MRICRRTWLAGHLLTLVDLLTSPQRPCRALPGPHSLNCVQQFSRNNTASSLSHIWQILVHFPYLLPPQRWMDQSSAVAPLMMFLDSKSPKKIMSVVYSVLFAGILMTFLQFATVSPPIQVHSLNLVMATSQSPISDSLSMVIGPVKM